MKKKNAGDELQQLLCLALGANLDGRISTAELRKVNKAAGKILSAQRKILKALKAAQSAGVPTEELHAAFAASEVLPDELKELAKKLSAQPTAA